MEGVRGKGREVLDTQEEEPASPHKRWLSHVVLRPVFSNHRAAEWAAK